MSPLDRVPKDAVVGARSGESRVRSLPATAFFVFGAVLLLLATRVSIPALVEQDFDPLLAWFVSAGFGVFLPLFLVGWVSVRREGGRTPLDLRSDRLRFRRLDRSDWRVCGGSLAAIGLLTGLITLVMLYFKGRSVLHPAFLPGLPLSAGRYWLLGVWPVFFTANILGRIRLARCSSAPAGVGTRALCLGVQRGRVDGFSCGNGVASRHASASVAHPPLRRSANWKHVGGCDSPCGRQRPGLCRDINGSVGEPSG